MLASGMRMETSDKCREEPANGGEFGLEMLTIAQKKGAPLDFEESFRKLDEGKRNAKGRLRVCIRKTRWKESRQLLGHR
jgi:hypothetical protein